ncbi:hypothetical protein C8F01DRAFT_1139531 [Mycena amicta]|nr:hypothetical protein C8F01DRAFT_1139531 [Mycena amicta]
MSIPPALALFAAAQKDRADNPLSTALGNRLGVPPGPSSTTRPVTRTSTAPAVLPAADVPDEDIPPVSPVDPVFLRFGLAAVPPGKETVAKVGQRVDENFKKLGSAVGQLEFRVETLDQRVGNLEIARRVHGSQPGADDFASAPTTRSDRLDDLEARLDLTGDLVARIEALELLPPRLDMLENSDAASPFKPEHIAQGTQAQFTAMDNQLDGMRKALEELSRDTANAVRDLTAENKSLRSQLERATSDRVEMQREMAKMKADLDSVQAHIARFAIAPAASIRLVPTAPAPSAIRANTTGANDTPLHRPPGERYLMRETGSDAASPPPARARVELPPHRRVSEPPSRVFHPGPSVFARSQPGSSSLGDRSSQLSNRATQPQKRAWPDSGYSRYSGDGAGAKRPRDSDESY